MDYINIEFIALVAGESFARTLRKEFSGKLIYVPSSIPQYRKKVVLDNKDVPAAMLAERLGISASQVRNIRRKNKILIERQQLNQT